MTLKAKLLITTLALVALALVVSDIVASKALRSYLLQQTDSQLAAARGPVNRRVSTTTTTTTPQTTQTTTTATSQPALPPPPNSRFPSQFISDFYIEVRNADGTVDTQLTPTVRGADDPKPELTHNLINAHLDGSPFTVSAQGSDDFKYRAIATPTNNGQVVITAVSLENLNSTIDRLERTELFVTSIVLFSLGMAAWWILRVELRQLDAIAGTAGAIAAGDLSQRIPASHPKTEIGQLSDALNSMLSQIEASFREREESEERLRRFAADASHELRTPITAVRGYAELYRQGAIRDDAHLQRVMARIESESTRMGMLVEDLLMLARLDQGRPLETEPVNIANVVKNVVDDSIAVDPQRPINFEVDNDPLMVVGDSARLHQVFSNLLGNAITHTAAGTEVTVRVSADDGDAVISVADQGPGLPEDARARVFERFYRVDAGRARSVGGNGLGLSIVKSIVEAHNGSVDVESELGNGATFIVRLPKQVA